MILKNNNGNVKKDIITKLYDEDFTISMKNVVYENVVPINDDSVNYCI